MHTYNKYVHMYIHTCRRTYIHIHMYMHAYIHAHIRMSKHAKGCQIPARLPTDPGRARGPFRPCPSGHGSVASSWACGAVGPWGRGLTVLCLGRALLKARSPGLLQRFHHLRPSVSVLVCLLTESLLVSLFGLSVGQNCIICQLLCKSCFSNPRVAL